MFKRLALPVPVNSPYHLLRPWGKVLVVPSWWGGFGVCPGTLTFFVVRDLLLLWVPSFGTFLFSFFFLLPGQQYGDGCARAAHPSLAF